MNEPGKNELGNHQLQDNLLQNNELQDNQLRINASRLQHNIQSLAVFGLNTATGGLDRTTFTPAELAAREWLKAELLKLHLAVRVDAAANIWALRSGSAVPLPAIVFGSHIDTVPNGGKYDGALGVLLALEVMAVLEENKVVTRHPLELVSFSAEEPNPFGLSTFGSRAVSGKLKARDLTGVRNDQGGLLTEALRLAGGDPEQFGAARRRPEELAAFLEVHIEQGKRLLDRDIPVGIVTAITGIYREEITVMGEANHAGTTLMGDRKDALMGASEIMLAFEAVCRNHPADEVVGTIGRISNEPNAANIIPEKATFHLEIRGEQRSQIQEVLEDWGKLALSVAEHRGLRLERRLILDQNPEPMDSLVISLCAEQAEKLEYSSLRLGSMAGHDATHMASLTRAGMLFVPSLGGKSHCPEEESRIEDIEKAGNVLLRSILALDQELNR
ncbi:putative hydrolase [compost metagenome]